MKQYFIFLTLALAAILTANAGGTYYSKVTASVASGEGKVYVSTSETFSEDLQESATNSTEVSNPSTKSVTHTYFLFAEGTVGSGFKQWNNGSTSNPLKVTVTATSTKPSSPTSQSYTATFEPSTLLAKSAQPSLGLVSIDKPINTVGDVVTLKAKFAKQPIGGNEFGDTHTPKYVQFDGWYNEAGEKLSDQMTITYTVQKVETIEARFSRKFTLKTDENGNFYGYYRLETPFSTSGRYFLCLTGGFTVKTSTSDRTLYGAIEFNQQPGAAYAASDAVFADAGCIFYVSGKADMNQIHNTSDRTTIGSNMVGEAQGTSTKDLTGYEFLLKTASTPGYYILTYSSLSLQLTYYKRLWVTTDKPSNYSYKDAGDLQPLPVDIEHIEDNYFGAYPDASMEYDGGYWTSMYTSFPYECYEPDGVEAYVVSHVAGFEGQNIAVIRRLESGIVPAATPVLLKCKGLTPRENRLIPLMPDDPRLAAAASEIGENNILTGEYGLFKKAGTVENPSSEAQRGSGRATYDANTMRVFSVNGEGAIGFYKLAANADASAQTLTPNRAYLDLTKLPAEAQAISSFRIMNDHSGLENITVSEETDAAVEYFTLDGIKVAEPVHGNIYIVRQGSKVRKIVF